MSRFQLVIFDMDGVLTDSSPGHARAYQDLWRRIGIKGPAYDAIRGRPTGEVIAELTSALLPDREQLEEWVRFKQDQARRYLSEEPATFPDTVASLVALQKAGMRLAVGTSASRQTTELLLAQDGILSMLDVLVTSEDVSRGKPAPDTYQLALERTKVPASDALVVEDSVAGLQAAAATGAWTAAVRAQCQFAHPLFLGNYPDLRALLMALFVPFP